MNLNAFFKMTYGVYILSTSYEGKKNGCIANSVFQITSEPARLMAVLNKNNYTHELLEKSKIFSLAILNEDTPFPYIGIFGFKSGRDVNKYDKNLYITPYKDIPVPNEWTIAYFICKADNKIDFGTHTGFYGEVIECDILKDGKPLTYAYYHEVKKGKTAKNAPTFIKQ